MMVGGDIGTPPDIVGDRTLSRIVDLMASIIWSGLRYMVVKLFPGSKGYCVVDQSEERKVIWGPGDKFLAISFAKDLNDSATTGATV